MAKRYPQQGEIAGDVKDHDHPELQDQITALDDAKQPAGNYQPAGDYVPLGGFNAHKAAIDPNDVGMQHNAEVIAFQPVGGLLSDSVSEALTELDADLTAHIVDAVDAHDASAISLVPAGAYTATNVQSGITELDADLTAHWNSAQAHPASAIVYTPAGNIAATNLAAAIAELDSEKQPAGSYALASHVHDFRHSFGIGGTLAVGKTTPADVSNRAGRITRIRYKVRVAGTGTGTITIGIYKGGVLIHTCTINPSSTALVTDVIAAGAGAGYDIADGSELWVTVNTVTGTLPGEGASVIIERS